MLNIPYESTSTGWMFLYNKNAEDIREFEINHPEDVTNYLVKLPNLTSVIFDHTHKKAFDYGAQIKSVLSSCSELTRFSIRRAKYLEELPIELTQHPIQSLTISYCPKLTNLAAILKQLPYLEELKLYSNGFVMEKDFPAFAQLKYLRVIDTPIKLNGLEQCKTLEHLELIGVEVEKLPNGIEQLENLKLIRLQNLESFEAFPQFQQLNQLLQLDLVSLPKLKTLPDFSAMPLLRSLELTRLEQLQELPVFPILPELSRLKVNLRSQREVSLQQLIAQTNCLETVDLNGVGLTALPEELNQQPKLKQLYLSGCNELPPLEDLSLQELSIRHSNCTELPFDLSNIREFYLENCQAVQQLPISISESEKLRTIELKNLPMLKALPVFSAVNEQLQNIIFEGLPKVTTLPATYGSCPNLEQLNLELELLDYLPKELAEMKSLLNLRCSNSRVKVVSEEFMKTSANLVLSISEDQISSFRELHQKVIKIEEPALKKAVFFWVRNGFLQEPVSDTIKEQTLKALHLNDKILRLLVLRKIHYLNAEQAKVQSHQIENGSVVWLNGTMGNKTQLKNKLKERGCKVVQKFSPKVSVIVLGAKPKFEEGMLAKGIVYAQQNDMEEIIKTENPSLLQQEDIPLEFIENLRALLWSNQPENEAIALEMVKTNGMPTELEDEFFLSAKICADKNVKNRIRTFLKGKISEAKTIALSRSMNPFSVRAMAYINGISNQTIANLFYSYYKRTGSISPVYFQYADASHPYRSDVLMAVSKQWLLAKKIQTGYKLLANEINTLVELPQYENTLKTLDLNLECCDTLPSSILLHKNNLIHLLINVRANFDFTSIYELEKLTQLTIRVVDAVKDVQMPEGITQLKRLTKLNVTANEHFEVILPKDSCELKKLK